MKHYISGARSIRHALAGGLVVGLVSVLVACGGGGTTPVTGVQVRPLSPEFGTRKAVSYSPYRTATNSAGLDAEVIPPANIKQDLDLLLAGGFRLIRLFGSSDKVAKQTLQVIYQYKLDMRVQLGAYTGGDTYASAADKATINAANLAELARAVALATDPKFKDIILAVSVGNETQVDFSGVRTQPETLAGYLRTVRNQITQPVTTDDNFAAWAGLSNLIINEVDFASIHTYVELDTFFNPTLWNWRQKDASAASRAAAMMDAALIESRRQYTQVRAFLDSKGLSNMPVTIGETGWNVIDPRLPFRAQPANQKMYLDRLNTWAAEGRAGAGPKAVIYFEAFDEPWKQGDDGWGLFNVKRQARYVIQSLGTCGVTWACEPGAYTDASALYFVPPLLNAVVAENKYSLFTEAALGVSEVRPTGLRWDAFDGDSVNAPEVTTTSAPGDATHSIAITPQPKNYGWGFLNQSATTPPTTANLSGFAGGSVRFYVNTTYPGKIEIGISSDTQDRDVQEAYLQIGSGDYGYCNTGAWCPVTIPLAAFAAANPKLDLSLVLSRFIIADRYAFTGKALNSNITTKLNIDAIYWSR